MLPTLQNGLIDYASIDFDVTYYVSSSEGDDDTGDGLSPETAYATAAKVMSEYPPTTNQHALYAFKYGDTFTEPLLNYNITVGGQDSDHPLVFGAYGNPDNGLPLFDIDFNVHNVIFHLGGTDGGDSVLKNYIHIFDLAFTCSIWDGSATSLAGIEVLGHSLEFTIQNCHLHHLSTGIVLQAGDNDNPRDAYLFRNWVHDCFNAVEAQRGVGIIVLGAIGLHVRENAIDFCGWNEDRTTLSTTTVSAVGNTVVLTDGSPLNDAYNFGRLDIDGIGNWTILDYVASTKTLTVDGDATSTGGLVATIFGCGGNINKHNTYFEAGNSGVLSEYNISTRAANHGHGRGVGRLYGNIVQDCPTSFTMEKDAAPDGGELFTRRCIALGPVDFARAQAFGISTIWGFEIKNQQGETMLTEECVCAALTIANGGGVANVFAFALSGMLSGFNTTLDNCAVYQWQCANGASVQVLLVSGQAGVTKTISNCRFQQTDGSSYLCSIVNTASGTQVFEGNEYHQTGGGSTFYYFEPFSRNFGQWQSDTGDDGTFTEPDFTSPGRNLLTYDESLEGPGTFPSFYARYINLNRNTWTEEDNGIIPILNYLFEPYGYAPLDMLYTTPPEPVVVSYLPTLRPSGPHLYAGIPFADNGTGNPATGGIHEDAFDSAADYLQHGTTAAETSYDWSLANLIRLGVKNVFANRLFGDYGGSGFVAGDSPASYPGGAVEISIDPHNQSTHVTAVGTSWILQLPEAFAVYTPSLYELLIYCGPAEESATIGGDNASDYTSVAEELNAGMIFDANSILDYTADLPQKDLVEYLDGISLPLGIESWERSDVPEIQGWLNTARYILADDVGGRPQLALSSPDVYHTPRTLLGKKFIVFVPNTGPSPAARTERVYRWMLQNCHAILDFGGYNNGQILDAVRAAHSANLVVSGRVWLLM